MISNSIHYDMITEAKQNEIVTLIDTNNDVQHIKRIWGKSLPVSRF